MNNWSPLCTRVHTLFPVSMPSSSSGVGCVRKSSWKGEPAKEGSVSHVLPDMVKPDMLCIATSRSFSSARERERAGYDASQRWESCESPRVWHWGDRKWSLNDGRILDFRGIRVALGAGFNPGEGNRRATRNGLVSRIASVCDS
jgi:hypothetical protein